MRTIRLLTLVLAVLVAACGGGSSDDGSDNDTTETSAATETTTAAEESSDTTLRAGAVAGLDDYDGNGEPDPTCGTQDFGAGLVLRIPCEIEPSTANSLDEATTLVKDSMYRLPGSTGINLDGISGSIVLARDTAGQKVVIFVFNSSALFETGSDAISERDSLDNVIKVINSRFANGTIQVRGHTDSTGSAASNQALSERRAAVVRDYLRSNGAQATEFTSVGLASTQPLTEERNPDGSPNEAGMRFNRRVEIVIRTK